MAHNKAHKTSEFDVRLQEMREERKAFGDEGFASEAALVIEMMVLAGVSETKIAEVRANPSQVAFLQANPDLITRMAQQYPAGYAIDYFEARTQAGLGAQAEAGPQVGVSQQFGAPELALNPELAAARRGATGPAISPTGAQQFEGGVFVYNGQVFFPPNDPNVMGSPAWMSQVPRWSDEQRQSWAKTLKQNGYIDSVKVDLVTFTDALKLYHDNRFLYGGGQPVDISQGDKGVTKADFGGILDPAVLDTEVRSWYQEIFGTNDEPSEEELKRGRERLSKIAMRLAKNKDMVPADAASVASARVQERFLQSPETRKWQDLEETDTSLHDSFVNLFQVLSQ